MSGVEAVVRRTGAAMRTGLAGLGDAMANPRGEGPQRSLGRTLTRPLRHDGS